MRDNNRLRELAEDFSVETMVLMSALEEIKDMLQGIGQDVLEVKQEVSSCLERLTCAAAHSNSSSRKRGEQFQSVLSCRFGC